MAAISEDIFKHIFYIVGLNVRISIRILLKFVPKGNKSTLVQVMAWRWTSDKPVPERMLTQFAFAVLEVALESL